MRRLAVSPPRAVASELLPEPDTAEEVIRNSEFGVEEAKDEVERADSEQDLERPAQPGPRAVERLRLPEQRAAPGRKDRHSLPLTHLRAPHPLPHGRPHLGGSGEVEGGNHSQRHTGRQVSKRCLCATTALNYQSGIGRQSIGKIKGSFICLSMVELRDYQPETGVLDQMRSSNRKWRLKP